MDRLVKVRERDQLSALINQSDQTGKSIAQRALRLL